MCEVRSLDALDAIAVEWNALLASTPQDTPFARHEYVRAWWQTLGGGEWRAAELCVFTLRDGRGALRGVAPLFAATSHTEATTLRLLGACEVTDYLDLIAAPEDRGAAYQGSVRCDASA
jgi:hypothetical protein